MVSSPTLTAFPFTSCIIQSLVALPVRTTPVFILLPDIMPLRYGLLPKPILALGPRTQITTSSSFDSMVADPCWVALFDLGIGWMEQHGFRSKDPWLYGVNRLEPSSVITYTFTHVSTYEVFKIHVGQCLTWEAWSRLWVTVEFAAKPQSGDSDGELVDPVHGSDVRLRCEGMHLGDWFREDSMVACPVDVDESATLERLAMYSRVFRPKAHGTSAYSTLRLTVLDKSLDPRSATVWIFPDVVPYEP